MFKKKKKSVNEPVVNNDTQSFETTERDDIIDQDSIEEADIVISAMASKRRNEKNKKKSKEVIEEPKTVKFGFIEETAPVEELTPLYDTDGPLESVINQNAFNSGGEDMFDYEELTPIENQNNDYAAEDRNIFGQRNANDFVSEPMSDQRFIEPSYNEELEEPKTKKKEKKSKEKKQVDVTKRTNAIFTIGILLIIVGAILFALWPVISNKTDVNTDIGGQQMTNSIDNSGISNLEDGSGGLNIIIDLNPKLAVINNADIISLNESIAYIGQMNNAVTGHLNAISGEITKSKGIQNKTIENVMQTIKSSIQKDLATLQGYNGIYRKYGNLLIVERVKERLENAYKLADSTKNTMTDKAMVENANYYINIEKKLNEKTITEIVKYLDINEVTYEVKDGHIQYIPAINETMKAVTGIEIPDVNVQVNKSTVNVGEVIEDNSASDRDNIID